MDERPLRRLLRALERAVLIPALWGIFVIAPVDVAIAGTSTVHSGSNVSPSIFGLNLIHPAPAETLLDLKVVFALRNRIALDKLLADQQDPTSTEYHRWLNPQDFAARFGPTQADFQAVSEWLRSQGFEPVSTDIRDRYVRFSGSVLKAEQTFGVEIVASDDARLFGNTTQPSLPRRFAGAISHIDGLDNLRSAAPLIRRSSNNEQAGFYRPSGQDPGRDALRLGLSMDAKGINGSPPAFGPADLYTFYDETPLLKSGVDGRGARDCVAFVEDSDFLENAVTLFDRTFSLPAARVTRVFPTTNPGRSGTLDETEALLDIEWAHAVAPGARLTAYIGNPADAIFNPIVDALQRAVNANSCGAISISFGFCGAPASFYTGTLDSILAQAASQGQSVFVSSGDFGAAGDVFDPNTSRCSPGTTPHVSELSADPNVTSVGGTGFSPAFDSASRDVGFVSESVWSDSSGAGGGGESALFAKPSYQIGATPADGMRDVPDVSMIASPLSPGVIIGGDISGHGLFGLAKLLCCAGGTSLSAPLWAGISKLLQQTGGARVGNINRRIYELGPMENAGSIGLRDVTSGSNDFNGVTGFQAGPLYDQASGWGTPDIAAFVKAFPTVKRRPLTR